MDDLCRYAGCPFAFMFRYVRLRPVAHLLILTAVVAAVACSVSTQYGVKCLVDALSGNGLGTDVWTAFLLLVSLISADNLLWRLASWVANFTFVGVTGDLRRDLFRHLTGHSPSYFADRLPGMLTSRVTATSNAVFTVENMSMWNVVPPCAATIAAIGFVQTISIPMATGLALVGGIMVVAMFRLAAAGRPLHHDFADKTAAVDGEMVDVVSNMHLVRVLRLEPGASPLRRDHRSRTDGAPAQPALSRKIADHARFGDHPVDVRIAGLGDRSLATRARDDRRCGSRMHPGNVCPSRDA
jgi:ATP-binding cassette subfamily B protein